MNTIPLISICIPIYNGEKYLGETLESIKNQTYKNIEVIVSDDQSTDDSMKIINEFKRKVSFPVFVYQHKPQGIGANWNNCIFKANGEYIKFVFQDDVIRPECVELMVEAFFKYEGVGMVACKRSILVDQDYLDEEVKAWIDKYSINNLQKGFKPNNNGDFIFNHLTFGHPYFLSDPINKIGEPSVVLFKKSIVDEVGYFDKSLKQNLDFEFWYRIMKIKPIVVLGKELASFRVHSEQQTNINRKRKVNEYRKYMKLLYDEYFDLLSYEDQKMLKNEFKLTIRIKRKIKNALKKILLYPQ